MQVSSAGNTTEAFAPILNGCFICLFDRLSHCKFILFLKVTEKKIFFQNENENGMQKF